MGEHDGEGRAGSAGKDAPRTARDQEQPEPERPRTPAEEAGVAPHQVDDPPQAEGDDDEG